MPSEDYSYCSQPCENTECVRNNKNIIHPEILHSYVDYSKTDECLERSSDDDSN